MNGKRKLPIIATSAYLLLLIIVFIVLALAPNGDGTGFIWLVILVFPAGRQRSVCWYTHLSPSTGYLLAG